MGLTDLLCCSFSEANDFPKDVEDYNVLVNEVFPTLDAFDILLFSCPTSKNAKIVS